MWHARKLLASLCCHTHGPMNQDYCSAHCHHHHRRCWCCSSSSCLPWRCGCEKKSFITPAWLPDRNQHDHHWPFPPSIPPFLPPPRNISSLRKKIQREKPNCRLLFPYKNIRAESWMWGDTCAAKQRLGLWPIWVDRLLLEGVNAERAGERASERASIGLDEGEGGGGKEEKTSVRLWL